MHRKWVKHSKFKSLRVLLEHLPVSILPSRTPAYNCAQNKQVKICHLCTVQYLCTVQRILETYRIRANLIGLDSVGGYAPLVLRGPHREFDTLNPVALYHPQRFRCGQQATSSTNHDLAQDHRKIYWLANCLIRRRRVFVLISDSGVVTKRPTIINTK